MTDATERALIRLADELRERQATVHERQRCPTCWAPIGVRCRPMPKGYVVGPGGSLPAPLKNPHRERLQADGLYDR